MGLFFNKEEKPQELKDPFDDRLVIDLPNGSATLGYCRNAIKGKVQEILSLINDIKENPKFKKAEELLNKNLVAIEEQTPLISKNKELLEKHYEQTASSEVQIINNEKKNEDIAERQTLCLTELNKKIEEIKNISTISILENFKKEHQEKFLKGMADYKIQLNEYLHSTVDTEINNAIDSATKQVFEIANNKLQEIILKIGLETEKTIEWAEAQIKEPLVFIEVLISQIKSDEKDIRKLEVMKKHLKEIISKDEYNKELSEAVASLNSYIDLGKNKGDAYEKNCLVALRNLQMSIEGYYSEQKEKEKAKEEKKRARETKREKPKTQNENAGDDEEDDDLGDAEMIEKETEETGESSDILDDFKIRI